MDSKLDSQFRRQLGSYIRSSTDIWLVTQKPHFYRHVPKETKHANTHRKQVHCHFTAALLKISKYRNNYVVSQKSMECFYLWAYPSVQRYDLHAAQVDARDLLQSEQTDCVNTVHFPYRTWAATDCRDCHLRLEGCWATSPYLCFHAVLHHQNSQSYPCKGLTLLYGLYPPRRVAMRSTQRHLSQQGKDDQLF